MAMRTLTTTWKQLEKLAEQYEGRNGKPKAKAKKPKGAKHVTALDELSAKINESKIVDALARVFVKGYEGLQDVNVKFATSGGSDYPEWTTAYFPETQLIEVNPVGVYRFCRECDESPDKLKTPAARKDFTSYRYQAYLAELRKLPPQYKLFLQLLNQIAVVTKIATADKRGSSDDERENVDERYMNLLWAFKQLETFFAETNGIDLRSEFSILWYESDWILGKR